MLTVYGRQSSANVQKVHWICAEGNLEFKAVNVGGKYGGHTSSEFKQMNPNSTVPVLMDDDFIIYESNSQKTQNKGIFSWNLISHSGCYWLVYG